MLTLVQLMTFDDASEVYSTLMLTGNPWLLVPYFSSFMLLAGIALMNWVTALMVESSIQQAAEDREAQRAWEAAKKRALIPKLQEMFFLLDSDDSGKIELSEIQEAPQELKDTLAHVVNCDSIDDLFRMLDFDGSGYIEIGEFMEGIMMAQGNKPLELHC